MNTRMTTLMHPRKRVAGEPLVWLTAMGLSLGLIMVFSLLVVILWNGIDVFWPKKIEQFTLRIDGKETVVAGEVVKVQFKTSAHQGVVGEEEMQLFTGNKDIYGQGFRFIHTADIQKREFPTDALLIERMEYGNAIGAPIAIQKGESQRISASDENFRAELYRLLDEVTVRRAAILTLEQDEIGENSRAITALKYELNGLPEDSPKRNAINSKITVLEKEYQEMNTEAKALRANQLENKLIFKPYGGQEREVIFGDIVSFTWSNELSFIGRIWLSIKHIYSFITDNPREANTEGGIWPAIFGTFVMTLLMSVAVTPFGVVAAIYLREYARQGPIVRGVRIAVNNLAGVPSIVFGVFGLGFFVYIVGGSIDSLFFSERLPTPTFGTGGVLWASLTLALMTVPVVIVATEESIAAVPRGAKEGSLALGASKWQTIQRVVLPAAVPGILTGLILAMARGAGEVAPLMLVGVVKLVPNLPIDGIYPFVHLDQKFMHLGFHIYDLGFQSPDSEAAKPMVYATTFILIMLVMLLNLGAIILRERIRRRFATSAF